MMQNRCKAKPDVAHPIIPLAASKLLLNAQLIDSPASIESNNLFACASAACSSCTHRPVNRTLLAARRDLADCTRTQSSQMCGLEVDFAHKIGCHGNVP